MEKPIDLVDVMVDLLYNHDHYIILTHSDQVFTIGCRCALSDRTLRFEYLALIDNDRVRDARQFILAADPEFFVKVIGFLDERHKETANKTETFD